MGISSSGKKMFAKEKVLQTCTQNLYLHPSTGQQLDNQTPKPVALPLMIVEKRNIKKTEKKWFFVMTLSLCLSQQIAISSLTAQHFGVMSGNPRYAIDYLIKCLPSTKSQQYGEEPKGQ